MSNKYLENDTAIVKYKNLAGDTKQVIISPVGYFNTVKGLKFVKSKVPFKKIVGEFLQREDKEKNVDIEVIFDFIFDLNEHLGEASKYFIHDESFDITQVRDIEDLMEILKAVYEVNKIGESLKNLIGSQAKKGKQ